MATERANHKCTPSHDHHDHSQHGHVYQQDHSHSHHGHHHHQSIGGVDVQLWCAVLACGCLGIGWLTSQFSSTSGLVPLTFYLISYTLTGWFMVREAVERLRHRRFEIESLMLLAAVGAAYLGKWAEGALLLCLFSIGHALEHFAMGRARRAIEALSKLAPTTATVQREGQWIEVPVQTLQVGERVSVKPHARVSTDGFVVRGSSSVDQAPITGESIPVDKLPVQDLATAAKFPDRLPAENRVYAGTINGAKVLEVQVTQLASDNTLSRIVQLVSQAETRVSPTQSFTRRIERYYVPAVLIFDMLLLLAWLVIDEPFSASLYRAMSVLVAASPCALAISTPSAVLAGVARAASRGVLVKGGGPLESLGTIQTMAFDKTGTLTAGKPRLTDVLPAEGSSVDELLTVAIAVEALSDHPLAMAIVRDAGAWLGSCVLPTASALEAVVGRGIRARLDAALVSIGKETLFLDDSLEIPPQIMTTVQQLKRDGRTTMIVKRAERYLGVLGVMDTPRPSARQVIDELRALGVQHMTILSGDHQLVVEAVAKHIGIGHARGDLMPEDKVRAIQELRAAGNVAMIGDGVNDAPALASATVGIAMGAAGSAVALETADVALMGDDLQQLPFAVGLSRRTRAIIQQNLWISLGMVAFLVPAATLGLPLGPAVALHEGSTLVVAANALRLLWYRQHSTY